MSDHTPGPWELIGDAIMPDPRRHLPDTMLGIANIQDHGSDRPLAVHRANARLIAAAPDLLEALEALTANYADVEPGGSKNVDKARAALAKARGTPC